MSSSNRDETYNPQGEDNPHSLTHDDVDAMTIADLEHLVAWSRQRRRLWLLAEPGLGLIAL